MWSVMGGNTPSEKEGGKIMKERFVQLDALRGLASLAVLFSHILIIIGPTSMGYVLHALLTRTYSPFQIIVNGFGAVILFFVLSGFVLSLPLLNGKRESYSGYLVKRFFRIYVPYILSFFVALLLLSLSPKLGGPLPYLSDYYNQKWTHDLSMNIIMEHVIGIVNVHTEELNSSYWSLVHEMRISIFFPFIVLLLRKVRWYYTVLIGLTLFGVTVINEIFGFQTSNGLNTTYIHSLHYLSFFIYGMFLAKHRTEIMSGFQALKGYVKYGILVLSLICYNSSYAVIRVLDELGIAVPFDRILREQIIAIGVIGFVIIALSSRRIGNALRTPIPLFLGNISYSLYLYHMVIFLALMHGFMGVIPLPYLLILSFVVSMAVAYIGWNMIEKPTIAIGKRVAARLQKRASMPPIHSSNR